MNDGSSNSGLGLRSPSSAHLVGVCGSGMKALAELLADLGWRLSGTDLQPANASIDALIQRGFVFHCGHDATNMPTDAECLVYSPAIAPSNPERAEALRRGVPQWSYSQMIGRLMSSRVGVCIAGTHGKSTTTAMVGWILTMADREPSVLVGAELCDDPTRILSERGGLGLPVPRLSPCSKGPGGLRRPAPRNHVRRSGWAGAGGLFVVESCEFQRSFLDFNPQHAMILSVEPDHFDCYADLPSVVQVFGEFAQRVPADGVLAVRGACAAALEAVQAARAKAVTFGVAANCEWRADNIRRSPEGDRFQIVCRGKAWGDIELQLHGDHNVLNALAAAALCAEIGLSSEEVIAGLRSFGGIRRRFEVVGEWNGITLIDDYAHHPTAVQATLRTARQVYGAQRIWCAFQPHQVLRTVSLMEDFAASFDEADEVFIAPVFAAREHVTDEPARVSQELAQRIASRGVAARFAESLDRIVATVEDAARPGDVLIAMGAGDIDRIHHEFTRRVR